VNLGELSFVSGEQARFGFDGAEGGHLSNAVRADQPAVLRGENRLVAGRVGEAVQFSGDDAVDLPVGNFQRHQPFSVSLWLKTPDVKSRAVVMHRSRAWTDAASRGYELLIEDGRLKWSLIHFWPGNAASVGLRELLPLNEWVHVTVVSDGSSRAAGLSIYVNGQRAETDVIRDSLTREITGGGGDNIALGERFRDRGFRDGMIDDVRVFDVGLTALECLAVFDAASSSSLLGAWRSGWWCEFVGGFEGAVAGVVFAAAGCGLSGIAAASAGGSACRGRLFSGPEGDYGDA
jgi:hypothetical protein